MDFDNPKVYGDTSIADGLVFSCFFLEKMLIQGQGAIKFYSTMESYSSFICTLSTLFCDIIRINF